jgi:hypothetical protein
MSPFPEDRLLAAAGRLEPSLLSLMTEERTILAARGCGVLLRIERVYFILTAAHVLDEFRGRRMMAAGLTSLFPVEGSGKISPAPAVGRDADRLDAGVIRLRSVPQDIADGALSVADLEKSYARRPGPTYMVMGYAGNRTRVRPRKGHIKREISRFVLEEASVAAYSNHRCDPRHNIALQWDTKHIVRDGVRSDPPNLSGMSGCGIWRLDSINGPIIVGMRDKLVGIFTDRRDDRPGALVGTMVWQHLYAIRELYPDVAPRIRGLAMQPWA